MVKNPFVKVTGPTTAPSPTPICPVCAVFIYWDDDFTWMNDRKYHLRCAESIERIEHTLIQNMKGETVTTIPEEQWEQPHNDGGLWLCIICGKSLQGKPWVPNYNATARYHRDSVECSLEQTAPAPHALVQVSERFYVDPAQIAAIRELPNARRTIVTLTTVSEFSEIAVDNVTAQDVVHAIMNHQLNLNGVLR